jgi:hypothetical protein
MNKPVSILAFAFFLIVSAHSQVVPNKLDLFIGLQGSHMLGEEMIQEDGFITPALFPNMGNAKGFAVKGVFNLSNLFSLGAGLRLNNFENWSLAGYDVYNTALVRTASLSVILGLQSPYKETGLLNRLRFSLQLAPVIGASNFSADVTPFVIYNDQNTVADEAKESTGVLWGADISGGIDFMLSNDVGLYTRLGYQQSRISSKLYQDEKLSCLYYEGGVFFRLFKNKLFYF